MTSLSRVKCRPREELSRLKYNVGFIFVQRHAWANTVVIKQKLQKVSKTLQESCFLNWLYRLGYLERNYAIN